MTDQQVKCHATFEELIEELKAVAQWSCCLRLKELEQRVDEVITTAERPYK